MPINKNCSFCKNQFSLSPSKAHRQFCSPDCANKARIQATIKKCLLCSNEFKSVSTKHGRSKFCSKKCSGLFKDNKTNKICEICSANFLVEQSRLDAKYCSSKCYGVAKSAKSSISCLFCEKSFIRTRKQTEKAKYCSRKCYCKAIENTIYKNCVICSKQFKIRSQTRPGRFCSLECTHIFFNQKQSITCRQCGEMVQKSPYAVKEFNYCSQDCQHKYRAGIIKTENGIFKTCATCKIPKPFSAFDLATKAKYGIKGTCRHCDGELEFINKGIQPPSKPLLQIMYLVENRSQRQLAEIFGVSSHTISKLIKHYGIKARPTHWNQQFYTNCGHTVRSTYEVAVCNWLHENKIPHEYEPRLGIKNYKADFYANGYFIEVWGVSGNEEYNKRKSLKRAIYEEKNLKLIQIYSNDFALENQNRWSRKLEEYLL